MAVTLKGALGQPVPGIQTHGSQSSNSTQEVGGGGGSSAAHTNHINAHTDSFTIRDGECSPLKHSPRKLHAWSAEQYPLTVHCMHTSMYARFSTSKFTKVSSGGPTAGREYKGTREQGWVTQVVWVEERGNTHKI